MQRSIWLTSSPNPATPAYCLERALRQEHSVISIGPMLSPEEIKALNIESLKTEIKEPDIRVSHDVDMQQIVSEVSPAQQPELLLWVDSRPDFRPANLTAVNCKKAAYFIYTPLHLNGYLEWVSCFDYIFLAQKEHIALFKNTGFNNVYWLPLGCDPELNGKKSLLKKFDIGFAGSVPVGSRREKLLRTLSNHYPVEIKQCFLEELANHYSHSKIVFNCAPKNDLNQRNFEALCSGSFLLTDKAEGSGLTDLFHDGESLVYYNDEDIIEKAGYYLRHGNAREKIAAKGREMALQAHTFTQRINDMLDVVFEKRQDTPDAAELRDRSMQKEVVAQPVKKEYSLEDLLAVEEKFSAARSFVIPVLDLSSQTQYNFNTLLDDLEKVEGDVIVIFNSLEMADLFKDHQRITYYAIMSHNFGVARAWNIGLDMSNAPVTFILNSDLHFEPRAIQKLEHALLTLPDAAVVGPEGGFIDFLQSEDIERFVKGMVQEPFVVDNVSGFFFAVKTSYFHEGTLIFSNMFTPCYYEEWDLGVQVKAKGLKEYVVPVTEYEHEFNTKSRTGNLSYMRTEETVLEISSRNQKLFWKKWLKDINENPNKDHLHSLWYPYKMSVAEKLFAQKNMQEAFNTFLQINARDSEIASVNYYIALLLARSNHVAEARKFAEKAVALDPELLLARELLQSIS